MGFSAVSVIRGPGEIAVMVVEVTKRMFTTRFQTREFIEQAWFITSVTLMPTILVSVPFGAVISLQVSNLTGQLGAQSFAGATAGARRRSRGRPDRSGPDHRRSRRVGHLL